MNWIVTSFLHLALQNLSFIYNGFLIPRELFTFQFIFLHSNFIGILVPRRINNGLLWILCFDPVAIFSLTTVNFNACFHEKFSSKSIPVGKKTSTRCLKDVLPRQARHLAKTSCRCLKRKSESHLRKTFWRDLCKIYCRFLTEDVLKMSY